jgi:hypothetical protein
MLLFFVGSIFGLFSSESAKTIFAPLNTKAFAVETKVKEGTITSSPGGYQTKLLPSPTHRCRRWSTNIS